MDITKPPGIILNGIILEKSYFQRDANIPDTFKNSLSFSIQPILNKDGKGLNLFVTCMLNNKKSPIYGEFTYIGIFSLDSDKPNLTFDTFLDSGSALAILLPYLREEISSRMQKANLSRFANIPLFNAMQIMKELRNKQTSSKKKRKP